MFKHKKTWISSAHQGFVTENVHQNTLEAFALAAKKGADMIELDARATKDGVLIVNHNETVEAYDKKGNLVEVSIADNDYATINELNFFKDRSIVSKVPTLKDALDLVYFTGMCVNIDLKEVDLHAEDVANLVVSCGMRGRTVYATNGGGAKLIEMILKIDPEAKFIDTKYNYTKQELQQIKDYQAKCFVYTYDFSDENIAEIRESGCMLAVISLNADNAIQAFRHHPDMAEYPHTSDFEEIDKQILKHYGF